jgi:hypothetical protein
VRAEDREVKADIGVVVAPVIWLRRALGPVSMISRTLSKATLALVVALAALGGCAVADGTGAAAGSSSGALVTGASAISGTVFQDLDRNGTQGVGELPFPNIQVDLFDGNGVDVAAALTDSTGRYSFTGIASGNYRVAFDMSSWWSVRSDWVSTTTGSLFPSASLTLDTSAIVPLGLRPITRSSDVSAPISMLTAPNGLVINVYDDVVVPATIYDVVMAGLVGPEAASTTVFFDYGTTSTTSTSVAGSAGSYSGFRAYVYLDYLNWLDGGVIPISHEYGHAWSLYNAYMMQQDSTLASYLAARGLTGNTLVGSSYAWSAREMIAEDYRQLLGAPGARAAPQMNSAIPRASQVAGLASFLATVFTAPVSTTTPPPPAPPPPVAISAPTVSPAPVTNGGTVSCSLSEPATVTLSIRTTGGTLVRALLSTASEPSGALSTTWDRKDARGHRVASGSYVARVDATDGAGTTTTATATFQVK